MTFRPDNLDLILKKGLGNLFHLSEIYENSSILEKRQVIGSVYPEKPTFDGDRLRTTRINEAVRLMYTLDKELAEKEKGQSLNLETLSSDKFRWELKNDADSMAHILDDSFVGVSSTNPAVVHNSMDIEETKVSVFGNTALLTGRGIFVGGRKSLTCGGR
jgi:hypothetical protein